MAFLKGEFYRDTWAEIQLDYIEENVKSICHHLPDSTKLMAVVKANGYGHGAVEVAQTALEAGAVMLAVALLEEGIYLRKNGIEAPILVLGYCPPEYAAIAVEYSISLTVPHKDWLNRVKVPLQKPISVHIKCDTGMGRIGVQTTEELQELEEIILNSDHFHFEGIFTHFAKADALDTEYYHKQLEKFNQFLSALKVRPKWIHASNSAASLRFPEGLFNLVRSGITVYGLTPALEIKNQLPIALKQAFSLKTKLVHVKQVTKGAKISYGCTYEALEDEWIGTIPIGYADGWIRALQGQTVLINGERVPIVGRICMDQCMIKLPRHFPVGTEVTLIGKQIEDEITVDEIAEKLHTINYEVICMISNRVPRVYKKGTEAIKIRNSLLDLE